MPSENKEALNKGAKSLAEKYIWESSITLYTDIAGLEEQKNIFKENIILPSKFPQLFKGIHTFDSVFFLHGVGYSFTKYFV